MAWDVGPFDNEAANEWCVQLDASEHEDRLPLVRSTLSRVAAEDGYLHADPACRALAAAAVVAAHLPGGPGVSREYGPKCLVTREEFLEIPADLPELALRAVNRVIGDESEWCDLWYEAQRLDAAVEILDPIRLTLDQPGE
jgi:Domain of unknown function (DUF4259)